MTGAYDAQIKQVLGDDDAWRAFTADRESMDRAASWLKQARIDVQAQMTRRKDEIEAQGHRAPDEMWRAYRHWRSQAVGFQRLVDKRRDDLAGRIRGDNIAGNSTRQNTIVKALNALAEGIAGHQCETVSDGDLYALLDQVLVPHGHDGYLPVREMLQRRGIEA